MTKPNYPSDPAQAMLLCALHRTGAPATCAELHDAALSLMMAEGWPRRVWSALTAQRCSRLLRDLVVAGHAIEGPETKVNGRPTPRYALGHYDQRMPLPEPPPAVGEDHPLHGKTLRQQYVLFEVHDTLLQALTRQRSETEGLLQRHAQELARLVDRQRAQLAAAGLAEASA